MIKQLIHPDDISLITDRIQSYFSWNEEITNSSSIDPYQCYSFKVRHKNGKRVNIKLSKLNKLLQGKNMLSFISESSCSISIRELEVLRLLSKGDSSKIIAKKLNVCESTVVTHRKNLLSKFEAKNSAELIQLAFKNNLIN